MSRRSLSVAALAVALSLPCASLVPGCASPLAADRGSPALPRGVRKKGYEGGHAIYLFDTGKGLEVELVYVPPGDFIMGSDDPARKDGPRHTRRLEKGFFIGRYETTWRECRAYGAALDRTLPSSPDPVYDDDRPVVGMTHDDVAAFCDWAGLALPSEAQWEKAARGTDGRRYPAGDEWAREAYVSREHPDHGGKLAAPTGSCPAGVSFYGAHDMAGNVREYCADRYDPGAYARYLAGDLAPPPRTMNDVAVRGGSFKKDPTRLTCHARDRQGPYGEDDLGFRPVLNVP